mmetsp:Transcript_22396/g.33372  ORF Transcript_22396/g.33372 Transcript_22396/m.33372 type:complete len:149 (-) Transcript_22396:233-679(-)
MAEQPKNTKLDLIKEFQDLLQSARPWAEFAKDFKVPSNLEERVKTNLVYFKGNYVIISMGFTAFGLCIHPKSLVAASCCGIMLAILLTLKLETSPGVEITQEKKLLFAAPVVLLLLHQAGKQNPVYMKLMTIFSQEHYFGLFMVYSLD